MKPNKFPSISIIIPVLNEERFIGKVLDHIKATSSTDSIREIICVDGGSNDNTIKVSAAKGAKVVKSIKGRAKQMNFGAKHAQGEVLYFLHADTFTPKDFDSTILTAIEQGYESGCFRMQFDTRNPMLKFFAWLSRINHTLCRGGDQSLFVTKKLFERNKGFNEDYLIYEDTEFITRLYKQTKFKVLPEAVITSARKYREKGWVRVQFHFGMIHFKSFMGAGPKELYRYYAKNILNY
ncbi:MAG: TIGR04283 family arsenosugar biosynthesis glycosyltransferase [Allomuricauda sp.]